MASHPEPSADVAHSNIPRTEDGTGYGDEPDPVPLGQSSRRWVVELWEIKDNGDGHLFAVAGHYPHGAVPPQWRANWWMSLARMAHAMALGCEQEARARQAQSR